MMVTRLAEVSKSRMQVVIDEEFAFVLYKGELRLYHLKEGEEISKEAYEEIVEVLLPKRAKLRAMNLLKSKAYTVKQLTDKLKMGGYPEKIIKEAIAYVSSYGYLNDKQYALDYIEYRKESRGKTKIFNTLMQKGISKEVIEEAFEETVGDNAMDLEQKQILALLKKKNFDPKEAPFEEKQKIFAYLYRKGFQIDAIRYALSLDITAI